MSRYCPCQLIFGFCFFLFLGNVRFLWFVFSFPRLSLPLSTTPLRSIAMWCTWPGWVISGVVIRSFTLANVVKTARANIFINLVVFHPTTIKPCFLIESGLKQKTNQQRWRLIISLTRWVPVCMHGHWTSKTKQDSVFPGNSGWSLYAPDTNFPWINSWTSALFWWYLTIKSLVWGRRTRKIGLEMIGKLCRNKFVLLISVSSWCDEILTPEVYLPISGTFVLVRFRS